MPPNLARSRWDRPTHAPVKSAARRVDEIAHSLSDCAIDRCGVHHRAHGPAQYKLIVRASDAATVDLMAATKHRAKKPPHGRSAPTPPGRRGPLGPRGPRRIRIGGREVITQGIAPAVVQ